MTRLSWDILEDRTYLSGVERCVLYPNPNLGVPWNGVLSIEETELENEDSPVYLDGFKYRNKNVVYNYSGQIEAITYPSELSTDSTFGLCYATLLSNDAGFLGYEIHIIYNARAQPQAVAYDTINNENALAPFSWSISTKPIFVEGLKPTSHVVIKVKDVYSWIVPVLEDILYGSDTLEPRMPSIEELLTIFETRAKLRIIDHGDGTWTAETYEGYDDIISMLTSDLFEITWSSALYLDPNTYIISSY